MCFDKNIAWLFRDWFTQLKGLSFLARTNYMAKFRKKSRICLSCANTLSIGRCTSNGFGIDCSFHSYLIIQHSVNERFVLTKVVSKKSFRFWQKLSAKDHFVFRSFVVLYENMFENTGQETQNDHGIVEIYGLNTIRNP